MDADPRDTTDKVPLLPPVRALHDTFLYIHPVSPPTHTRSHGNSKYVEPVYNYIVTVVNFDIILFYS